MNTKNGEKKIRINTVFVVLTAALGLFALIFFVSETRKINDNQSRINSYYDEYSKYVEASKLMRHGSDRLTEEVRLYAVTGDKAHVDAYFDEANVQKSREKGLKLLLGIEDRYGVVERIEEAMDLSLQLMKTEFKSMKLASVARGETLDYDEVTDMALTEEELAMTAEEQADRARDILFDENYTGIKRKILADTNDVIDETILNMEEILVPIFNDQALYITVQQLNLWIFLLLFFGLTGFLIIHSRSEIKREKRLTSVEDETVRLEEQLSVAEENSLVDSLTGTRNRLALRRDYDKQYGNEIVLMMLDIDDFKGINDGYGHAVGDYVLKNFGQTMNAVFGKENCYRFGGDEFIVMRPFTSTEEVEELVGKARDAISAIEADGKTGRVKMSCGYVYGKAEFSDDVRLMLRQADKLLYSVKNSGKNGIAGAKYDRNC